MGWFKKLKKKLKKVVPFVNPAAYLTSVATKKIAGATGVNLQSVGVGFLTGGPVGAATSAAGQLAAKAAKVQATKAQQAEQERQLQLAEARASELVALETAALGAPAASDAVAFDGDPYAQAAPERVDSLAPVLVIAAGVVAVVLVIALSRR